MGYLALFFLAVGLSMDAFAVSVCKGLALGNKVSLGRACVPGLWFGGFQGLMPLLGWLLGSRFAQYITAIDHWIAFGLLAFLGFNMLREARAGEAEGASASATRLSTPEGVRPTHPSPAVLRGHAPQTAPRPLFHVSSFCRLVAAVQALSRILLLIYR